MPFYQMLGARQKLMKLKTLNLDKLLDDKVQKSKGFALS
jgi:hypothetical protein